jgi:hypothetical protein
MRMLHMERASWLVGVMVALVCISFLLRNPARAAVEPGWSVSTREAATTPENKRMLAKGRKIRVTGEIVDVSCYLQLGKRGLNHIPCGTKCVKHGEPLGILDRSGILYILFAEQHHPRRDGQADLRSQYLPSLGTTVTIDGIETARGGQHALFVKVPIDTTRIP